MVLGILRLCFLAQTRVLVVPFLPSQLVLFKLILESRPVANHKGTCLLDHCLKWSATLRALNPIGRYRESFRRERLRHSFDKASGLSRYQRTEVQCIAGVSQVCSNMSSSVLDPFSLHRVLNRKGELRAGSPSCCGAQVSHAQTSISLGFGKSLGGKREQARSWLCYTGYM